MKTRFIKLNIKLNLYDATERHLQFITRICSRTELLNYDTSKVQRVDDNPHINDRLNKRESIYKTKQTSLQARRWELSGAKF